MNLESVALIAVGGLTVRSRPDGLHMLWGLSSRTANDVFPFLLKMDMDALYGTFSSRSGRGVEEHIAEKEFRTVHGSASSGNTPFRPDFS